MWALSITPFSINQQGTISHLSVRVMHRILHFECVWIFSSLKGIEWAAACLTMPLWIDLLPKNLIRAATTIDSWRHIGVECLLKTGEKIVRWTQLTHIYLLWRLIIIGEGSRPHSAAWRLHWMIYAAVWKSIYRLRWSVYSEPFSRAWR